MPTIDPDPTEVMPVVPAPLDESPGADPATEPTSEHAAISDPVSEPTTEHGAVAGVTPPAASIEPDVAPSSPSSEPPSEPPAASPPRPGVDAPVWDDARDTYIQWDPEIEEWMEWSESQGRWVPISR